MLQRAAPTAFAPSTLQTDLVEFAKTVVQRPPFAGLRLRRMNVDGPAFQTGRALFLVLFSRSGTMRHGCAWLSAIVLTAVGLSASTSADDTAPPEPEPLIVKAYAVADLATPVSNATRGPRSADLESLVDLIELRTGSDCWSEGGGEGTIVAHEKSLSLIVRQTASAHERIAELLSELRSTLELAIVVDVRIISGDLAACEFETELGTSPFGLVDEEARSNLLDSVQEHIGLKVLHAPKVTALNGQSASLTIGNDLKLSLNSVVTGDHRYVRVWMDVATAEASYHNELLIPDGCTAVRELESAKSWMLVTTQVLHSHEPEEAAPGGLPERSAERFLVPAEELDGEVTSFRNERVPLIEPEETRVAAATLRWRAAESVPQRVESQPRPGATAGWVRRFEAQRIAPGEPATASTAEVEFAAPPLYSPLAPDTIHRGAVSHPRLILRMITPSDGKESAPTENDADEEDAEKGPPVAIRSVEPEHVISNFRLAPPNFDAAWTAGDARASECGDCNGVTSRRDRFVTPASAIDDYAPPVDHFTAAARGLEREGLNDLATELRHIADRARLKRLIKEIDRQIEHLNAEKERLQEARPPAPFVFESAVELDR
jgi:hypothetical protein